MADTTLKKWNGTAWEDVYPETTVGQIQASGTPSSSTYLRGDGTWATVTAGTGDIEGVTAGAGLTGGGTSGTVTVSHADTSTQASVNNSGRTYIQDITLDTYGHITGITSATETVVDTNTTYSAGSGLTLSGTTFSHTDTSSQGSVNNSNGTVIQDVTLDTYGHVTSLGSVDLDGRYYTESEADSRFGRFTNEITLNSSTTTAGLITELTNEQGCFQNNYRAMKVTWSYAGNSDLNTGHPTIGTIELAGCLIEAWGGTYKHIRITRPTTGTGGSKIAVYNDQGSSYSPGWREIWTSESDGSGSGLDADLLDGNHASAFYLASNPNGYTSNVGDITGVTAGSGISGGGTSGTVTISHADTSSAANLGASGRRYVTGLTFDTYGHVTGYTTGTETVVNTNTTYSAGTGITLSGTTFSANLIDSTLRSVTANAITTTGSRTYAVMPDADGDLVVNVPWVDTNTNTTYSAGGGLTLSGTTFSHTDTSSAATLTASGRRYVTGLTFDTYGHVTGYTTGTETVTDTNTTYSAGGGLTLSGTTFSHTDTSAQGSVNNSGNTMIQDITLDTYGHITAITSANVGWTWDQIRGRAGNAPLTTTGANGGIGGSIAAGATLAQGDTIMMEVNDTTLVGSTETVKTIIFTLGAADSTPTNLNQSIHYNTSWNSSTTHYTYTFKVGYSSSTLYFDDVYRVQLLDTSTASSVLTNQVYTLHVGRIWRLKA